LIFLERETGVEPGVKPKTNPFGALIETDLRWLLLEALETYLLHWFVMQRELLAGAVDRLLRRPIWENDLNDDISAELPAWIWLANHTAK
jgi:hypothetical protein